VDSIALKLFKLVTIEKKGNFMNDFRKPEVEVGGICMSIFEDAEELDDLFREILNDKDKWQSNLALGHWGILQIDVGLGARGDGWLGCKGGWLVGHGLFFGGGGITFCGWLGLWEGTF
jgi:hypothetical protein